MKKYLKTLIQIKKTEDEKAIVQGVFSSANEDRHGDIVMQNFDITSYKKNPVILDSHDHYNAESVIGKSINIKVKDGLLQGKIQFAVEENPKAKVIYQLIKGGYINAFSIGFIPKEFDNKGNILKSELLEISVVSVPANADALVQAKAKGIDIDILYDKKNTKTKKSNAQDTKTNNNDKNKWGKSAKSKGDNGKGNDKHKSDKKRDDSKPRDNGKPEDKRDFDENLEKTAFICKDYADNWDETNEFVRYKVKDILLFVEGTLTKTTLKSSMPKIFATVGNLPKDENKLIQMLFFDKNDGWNMDDAKKWFSSRQREVIGETKPTESISIGKTAKTENQKWIEAVKEENEKELQRLNKICKAIKLISGVSSKTLANNRADKNKVINKCLKELIKIKKK